MKSMWYDRDGKPMTDMECVEKRLSDPEYKFVGNTYTRKERVSTVWLGLDYEWGEGKPIIFETMVFGGKHDGHLERYSTESEAKKGHDRIVSMVVRPWWKRWGIRFYEPKG